MSCTSFRRVLTPTLYKRIDCSGPVETPRLVDEVRCVLKVSGPQPVLRLNVPSHLKSIEHVSQVDFAALPSFVKSSCDPRLIEHALSHRCSLACSTSSVTSALSHVYFAVSGHRPVNTSTFSAPFQTMPKSLTHSARNPAAIILHRKADELWLVDSDSAPSSAASRVLMDLGKSLEHKLTLAHNDYIRLVLKSLISKPAESSLSSRPEAFAFTKIGRFMVRSQLDCSDDDLPMPNQTFDLKTRAVLAIRHNLATYEEHLQYEISSIKGELNSFERELYDLSRTVMLKYSFQVRLGRMHGVFVAYHNTEQFFGFEYLPLSRMDEILAGDSRTAEKLFDISIKLLERILCEIGSDFHSEAALRILFRAPQNPIGHLQVFVELAPSVVDDLPPEELRARLLDKFNVQMPDDTSIGALKTRYEECLKTDSIQGKKAYELLPLYEKAVDGKLFLYTMDISHLVNGKPIDLQFQALNLKNSHSQLETQYRFEPETTIGPLSIAREYWYALKETEREESSSPRMFMYK